LPLLDGEHGRTELLAAALSALGSEKLEITVDDRSLEGSAEDADLLVEIIDEKLEQYRRVGLLLRGDSDPRRWASNH
jgi:hypothetical protein